MIHDLVNNQGYIHLDAKKFISDEIERGVTITKMSGELSADAFLNIFRKCIYAQLKQNKKFILSNIPNDFNMIHTLDKHVCKIQKLVYFTKHDGQSLDHQAENFNSDWVDIVGHYQASGNLVQVGLPDVDIINFFIEKRNRYCLLVGPIGSGKSTIAKRLKKDKLVNLIVLEKYKEKLIARLSTDDNPVDEVSLADTLKHLNSDLQKSPDDQITLLENFPYNEGGFNNIIDALGQPLLILRLSATPETVEKRFKQKNETEELSDEDKEILANSLNLAEELNQNIAAILKKSSTMTVYDIDVNIPQLSTIETISSIFRKRIFVTRSMSQELSQVTLKRRVAFLSARHGYQFIDIQDVYSRLDHSDPTQVKDPHCIVNIIKYLVDSNKSFSR